MPEIREIALFCIGRAVMFGSLAIAFIMLAFSFHPVLAFQSGAISTLMMSAVLVWRAQTASRRPPETTEVWLYVDESKRLGVREAHNAFAVEMRSVYARFAQISFAMACLMFAMAVLLSALGVQPYQFAAG